MNLQDGLNVTRMVLTTFLAIIGSYIIIAVVVWQALVFIKIVLLERKLRLSEIDWTRIEQEVNSNTKNYLVNEDKRIKIVAKKREPIERRIKLLKQERKFLLDKAFFLKK